MPAEYDLAIIGSGGGALAAAIRANTSGKSVVMTEHRTFDGTCVSTGYVLSKALITAAGARHVAVDAAARFPGVTTTADPINMPALVAGKQTLVESLRGEKYADVADSYGWQVLRDGASFMGTPSTPVLNVARPDGSVGAIGAHHYLVATGSRPWAPPVDGLKETGYLTSTTAMKLTEVPESLLVLGGGYVAPEQTQLFARLGSQATLLVWSRLASKEELEMSKAPQEAFTDESIRVVSRAVPTRISRDTGGGAVVTAALSGGSQEFHADQILATLGRRPVADGLNLDAVGVNTGDSGKMVVSDRLQSSNPRVWATGNMTGHPEFAYVAAHRDTLVVGDVFANADRSVDYTRLPRVAFTGPTIGATGMTEKDVLTAGICCDCRVLPLHHVPRALVNRDIREFIKIVVNAETKEILDLTTIARDAGKLAAADVHVLGRTVAEVANAWTPYLTMVKGTQIVAKTFATDPSLLSCCAWTATQVIREISF